MQRRKHLKIKVLNLKLLSKYFSKIIILCITLTILSRFLYKQKVTNACIKINLANFKNILGKEIALFDTQKNKKDCYSSQKILDQEFELAKLATTQTVANINQVDDTGEITIENSTEAQIVSNVAPNENDIIQSKINEPEVRSNN